MLSFSVGQGGDAQLETGQGRFIGDAHQIGSHKMHFQRHATHQPLGEQGVLPHQKAGCGTVKTDQSQITDGVTVDLYRTPGKEIAFIDEITSSDHVKRLAFAPFRSAERAQQTFLNIIQAGDFLSRRGGKRGTPANLPAFAPRKGGGGQQSGRRQRRQSLKKRSGHAGFSKYYRDYGGAGIALRSVVELFEHILDRRRHAR